MRLLLLLLSIALLTAGSASAQSAPECNITLTITAQKLEQASVNCTGPYTPTFLTSKTLASVCSVTGANLTASDEFADGEYGFAVVNSTLAIVNSAFTGAAAASVLRIYNSTVILRNVQFTASNASGSVVSANGSSLSLDGCTFSGNNATQSAVLHVFGIGSSLQVHGSSLSGNLVTPSVILAQDGASVTINSCSIQNNNAATAGVLRLLGGSSLQLQDTSLSYNAAGSSVVDAEDGSSVFISSCTLTGNNAAQNGVLRLLSGSSLQVQQSTLSANAANSSVLVATGGSRVLIEECTIANNNAAQAGVLQLLDGSVLQLNRTGFNANDANSSVIVAQSGCRVTVDSCTFADNNAAQFGVVRLVNSTVQLSDSTFSNNLANSSIISVEAGGSAVVSGCSFTGNNEAVAGVLHAAGSSLNIQDTTFDSNAAVVLAQDGSSIVTQRCSFINNQGSAAGVLDVISYGTLQLLDCNFTGNAANVSIVLAQSFSNATIDGCSFQGNDGAQAGAVYALANSTMTVTGCIFYNNIVDMSTLPDGAARAAQGSAAVTAEQGSTVTVVNCQFAGNQALAGGALYLDGSTGNVYSCSFRGNYASGVGGGAVWAGNSSLLRVASCSFEQNSAMMAGGALLLNGSLGSLNSVLLTNNTASAAGGALAMQSSVVNGANCLLTYNSVEQCDPTALSNAGSSNPDPSCGGGAALVKFGALSLSNCTVYRNTAERTASGIMVVQGSLLVTNSSLTEHKPQGAAYNLTTGISAGGVITCYSGCNLTATTSLFKDNQGGTGGAIQVSGVPAGDVTLTGCTFADNNASIRGGAAYISAGVINVTNCTFGNNSAQLGGAMDIADASAVAVVNGSFANNTASSEAGALSVVNSDCIQLATLQFLNNTAFNGSGGALSVRQSGFLSVCNASFVNNTAAEGGAVRTTYLGNSVGSTGRCGASGIGNTCAYAVCPGMLELVTNDTLWLQSDVGSMFPTGAAPATLPWNQAFSGMFSEVLFTNNSAVDGGGLLAQSNIQRLLMDRITAYDNNASGYGGAITLQAQMGDLNSVYLLRSNLTQNNATEGGGAVAYQGSISAVLKIGNSSVYNNTAAAGGAIYVSAEAGTELKACNVSENGATGGSGGGLLCERCTYLQLDWSTLENNTAAGYGGAVAAYDPVAVTVTSCTVLDNVASQGGGVYITSLDPNQLGAAMIANSQVTGNVASRNGSFNASGSVDSVSGQGGAVYLEDAVLLVVGSLVTLNEAQGNGGGFLVQDDCDGQAPQTNLVRRLKPDAFTYGRFAELASAVGVWPVAVRQCLSAIVTNSTLQDNIAAGSGGALLLTSAYGLESGCNGTAATVPDLLVLPDWAAISANVEQLLLNFSRRYNNSNGMPLDYVASGPCPSWTGNQALQGYGNAIAFPPSAINITDVTLTSGINSNTCGNTATAPPTTTSSSAATLVLLQKPAAGAADLGMASGLTDVSDSTSNSAPASRLIAIKSGDGVDLQVQVVDFLRQSLKGAVPASANLLVNAAIQGPSNPSLSGSTAVPSVSGIANFSDLVVRAQPGTYNISVTSSSTTGQLRGDTVHIFVAPCGMGEIRTDNGYLCSTCPPSTYSFANSNATCNGTSCTSLVPIDTSSSSDQTCQLCPATANCTGGAVLVPLPGYWHSDPQSIDIQRCRNPAACRGDDPAANTYLVNCQEAWYNALSLVPAVSLATQNLSCQLTGNAAYGPNGYLQRECSAGYTGNLCGVCQDSPNTWFSLRQFFQCESCYSHGIAVLLLVLLFLATLVFTLWLTYTNLQDNVRPLTWEGLTTTQVMKILTIYLQYLGIIAGLDFEWPGLISTASIVAESFVGGSRAFPYSCLSEDRDPRSQADVRVALRLALPLGVIVLTQLLYLASWLIGRRSDCRQPPHADAFGVVPPATAATAAPGDEPGPSTIPESPAAGLTRTDTHIALKVGPVLGQSNSGEGMSRVSNRGTTSLGHRPMGSFDMRDTAATSRASRDQDAAVAPQANRAGAVEAGKQAAAPSPISLSLGRVQLVALLTSLFVTYPALVSALLSIFSCYNLDDGQGPYERATWGQGYWVHNMNEECYDHWHLSRFVPVGIVGLALIAVGFPLLIGALLLWHRRRLMEPNVQATYGWLYGSYRSRLFLWDCLLLLQTLSLVCIEVFGIQLPVQQQALLFVCTLLLWTLVRVWVRPAVHAHARSLDVTAMSCLVLTVSLALLGLSQDQQVLQPGLRTDALQTAVEVALLVVNIALILYMVTAVAVTQRSRWQARVRTLWHNLGDAGTAARQLSTQVLAAGQRGVAQLGTAVRFGRGNGHGHAGGAQPQMVQWNV